jgi:hypothetical protein
MTIHLNRERIRWLLPCTLLLTLFVFVFPLQALAATATSLQVPSKLEKQVEVWVSKLAEQPPFKVWQTADPQIEALGPGTHGWLVLFTKEGKDVGYMVVHATLNGSFQLGEYGVGPFPLFSYQKLKQSLIDNGLISEDQAALITAVKHYVHPFAAAWEVTIGEESYWLDAKTAELLPVNGEWWKKEFPESKPVYRGPKEGSRVTTQRINETFDAYERLPWLTKEASFQAKDAKKLQSRLNSKQHLRYVVEPFGEAMLYAVPVVGYQRWSNGRLDLAVDMEGIRFIPIGAMLGKGNFYR